MRWAAQRPGRAAQILGGQVRACLDEALVVQNDTALEPLRVGNRAGHDEEVADRSGPALAGFRVPPRDLLEVGTALDRNDLGSGEQRDARVLLDPIDEIP